MVSFVGIVVSVVLLGGCHSSSHERAASLVFSSTHVSVRVLELRNEIESHPNDPNLHIELGRIFLSEKYSDAAAHEFEEALAIDSEHVQAYLLLALALQKQAKPDLTRAAKLLDKAVHISPQNAQAHVNLAQVCAERAQLQKSIDEFKKAIDLSSDPPILVSAHLGLMALYKKHGDVDKAEEEYDAARHIYPGVEELIRQAEIARITPAPTYGGGQSGEGDGLHPALEKRIEQAQEEIFRLQGKQNE